MQPAGSGDQLLTSAVELRLVQPARWDARERRDLRQRPPLQLRRLGIEPQLGGDAHELLVEFAMYPQGDLADP